MANIVPMVVNSTDKTRGDIFSTLLNDNIIMLTGQVTSEMAEVIKAQLLYLESVDPEKPVDVYIDSPGGSCQAGLSIYDTMKLIKNPVNTICVGLAASMGSFLLACGKDCGGKRMITKNSEVLIHQVLIGGNGITGQQTEVKIAYDHMTKTKEKLTRYLSEFSGQPYEKVYADCERDHWLTAEEALEYGLVDEIV